MSNLHVIKPPNLEKAKVDAVLLRELADRVESGEVTDFVVISLCRDAFEPFTNTSKWTTVALSRMLDAWAVNRVVRP